MGQEFLIDSNAIIDYLGDVLPEKGAAFMDSLPPQISVITRIEVLGWYNAPPGELLKLSNLINVAHIYLLNEPVIEKTIEIRQKHRLKTPDAIIAATALINSLTLVTRNTKDFFSIEGLEVMNPYEL